MIQLFVFFLTEAWAISFLCMYASFKGCTCCQNRQYSSYHILFTPISLSCVGRRCSICALRWYDNSTRIVLFGTSRAYNFTMYAFIWISQLNIIKFIYIVHKHVYYTAQLKLRWNAIHMLKTRHWNAAQLAFKSNLENAANIWTNCTPCLHQTTQSIWYCWKSSWISPVTQYSGMHK